MKIHVQGMFTALALLALSTINSQLTSCFAQGTAFTYQGQLVSGGAPANGSYNLTFTLFNVNSGGSAVAGPVTNSAVVITNGLFTVLINFGPGPWNGETNWVEIGVETNGASPFTTLTPRQQLTPTPYAITAENLDGTVGSGGLSGTYGSQITLNNAANQFSGSYTGNGGGLTNVNATSLGGLAAGSFWQLGGNSNVPTGSNVIGTLDNQFLDVRVSNVRVMRLRLFTDGQGLYTNAPNVIGGSSVNLTAPNVVGATIAGGGGNTTNGNALANEVSADFGTVGGGASNTAGYQGATVGGGFGNTAGFNYTTVSGGSGNTASSYAATVGGGLNNSAGGLAGYVTVGGGYANNASGAGSVIGGGGFDGSTVSGNTASGPVSVVGGGFGNMATWNDTTVAGGSGNTASSYASTVGGGLNNSAGGLAGYVTVGGGYANNASGAGSVIGGGGFDGSTVSGNTASGPASVVGGGLGNMATWNDTTVAGGSGNTASSYASTVGGGLNNSAVGLAGYVTVGGGANNTASGLYSTVPGGYFDIAQGEASFAAGYSAQALHDYTFVWSDGTPSPSFNSTAINQFLIYAAGGVGIGTNRPQAQLHVTSSGGNSFPQAQLDQQNPTDYSRLRFTVGGNINKRWDVAATATNFVIYSASIGANMLLLNSSGLTVNGTFVSSSDRNVKAGFEPVNAKTVLERLAAMPITRWHYTNDVATPHLGPMAQDFYAAFNVGMDDKHIATVDEEGVALAAIQGLNLKVESENSVLRAENVELKQRLEALEQIVLKQKSN
jgi:hypothetical protein